METPDLLPDSPHREPASPVMGRRSVEVKRVVEEFFCTQGEEGVDGRADEIFASNNLRRTEYDGDYAGWEDISRHTVTSADREDRLSVVCTKFPESPSCQNKETLKMVKKSRMPQEDVHLENNKATSVAESRSAGLKHQDKRLFPCKPRSGGYEAVFLRDRMPGLCRRSGAPSLSSPTESLGDILYQKTRHLLDCTVTGMKGNAFPVRCGSNENQRFRPSLAVRKDSDASTSRCITRKEQSVRQTTEIRETHDGRPLLFMKGRAGLPSRDRNNNTDPSARSSTSTMGKPSGPASRQEAVIKIPTVNRTASYIIREERKRCYYTDLSRQVEEKRQQTERERRRNATAEHTHNETMQFRTWGKPGGGAPNYLLDSVRRTKFSSTGIIPQEQLRCTGFCGTPFHLRFK